VFLFLLLIAGLVWISATNLLSESGIEGTLSRIDVFDVLDDYREDLYENMNPDVLDNFNFDDDSLKGLLHEDAVKAFLSKQLSAFLNNLLRADDVYNLSRDEIFQFFKNNEDILERWTGYVFNDSDYDALDMFLSEIPEQLTPETLMGEEPLGVLRFFLSPYLFVAIVTLCLLCGILIFIMQKRPLRTLLFVGAAMEAAGLLYILLGLLSGSLLGGIGLSQVAIMSIASLIGYQTLSTGLWALGVGGLITASCIFVNFYRKRDKLGQVAS